MATFFIVWFGQLFSLLGSGLTQFAIGVYIYQQTGSATQLSLVLLAGTLPRVFLAPLAGALVDRWDRRWVMIFSDTVSAFSTFLLWVLLTVGSLQIWHIGIVVALGAAAGVFQFPAYTASVTLLVPKEHYGRASGLNQLAEAISLIASPLLAGFLIAVIQMRGIILIDLATFLLAVSTLAVVRFPRPAATAEGRAARGSLWREAGYGWAFIRARPGLLGLLLVFASVNFSFGFHGALFTPLVLSFSTSKILGSILSAGGIGMLAGSALMSVWGGSRRKINSLMGAMLLIGACLILVGMRADPVLVGAGVVLSFAAVPVANGSSQAIWQAKVAPDVQGRVFAIRAMIAQGILPLTYLIAGPLADYVFEPLMRADGALAGSVGPLLGAGPGRGIGLIYLLMGISIVLVTVVGYSIPQIREVEKELPDFAVAAS